MHILSEEFIEVWASIKEKQSKKLLNFYSMQKLLNQLIRIGKYHQYLWKKDGSYRLDIDYIALNK